MQRNASVSKMLPEINSQRAQTEISDENNALTSEEKYQDKILKPEVRAQLKDFDKIIMDNVSLAMESTNDPKQQGKIFMAGLNVVSRLNIHTSLTSEEKYQDKILKPEVRAQLKDFHKIIMHRVSSSMESTNDPEQRSKIFMAGLNAVLRSNIQTSLGLLFSYIRDRSMEPVERIEKIKQLLQDKALLNGRDTHGNTPLILAAYYGALDVVELLIDQGAKVNAQNNIGNSALISGAAHAEVVELLLRNGANVLHKNSDGMTALHAVRGCLKSTQALIHAGADVDAKDRESYTPILEVINANIQAKLIQSGLSSGVSMLGNAAAALLPRGSVTDMNNKIVETDQCAKALIKARANPYVENKDYKSAFKVELLFKAEEIQRKRLQKIDNKQDVDALKKMRP